MRLWRVVLLLNLAIGVGLMLGYLSWGREAVRLQREAILSRQQPFLFGVDQAVSAQGVVRAVLPELKVIVLTHDEIPGYMTPMTMGFRVRDERLLDGLEVGDIVRVTLRGVPPNLEITELEREGRT